MGSVPDRRREWLPALEPFVASGRRSERPNIVFVFADDLGWGDLGCFGSLHNETPHLDQVAADGLRLTHAYSTSSTCSPTRIGLYTGRYPGRLVAGMQEPLVTRDERHGIPHEHPTLPSLLRDAGYRTAMFGKWHCGWLPWFSPTKAGFEEFFGNLDGAMDYFSHIDTAGLPDLYEGETPVEEVGYYTEMVSARAADYIRARVDEPFYLQVNYTAPHWPWEGPDDQAVSERVSAAQREGRLSGIFHYEGGSLETYRAMVKALDDGIGEVLRALDETGQRDNTLFIFSSDNGGERYAFMWPFVGEKGDLEEGGVRVPFLVRWPAVLDGGQTSAEVNGTMDWTATILEAAGVDAHPDYPLDGVSLLHWLTNGTAPPERSLLWRTRYQGAVRRGKWKLLFDRVAQPLWWFYGGDPNSSRTRLFDITVDGREWADVSSEHREVVDELFNEWREFDEALLAYEAPPARRPRGEAD
jgi:arylsulfatase A-like enzyme